MRVFAVVALMAFASADAEDEAVHVSFHTEPQLGPELFFDGKNFLMHVQKGIVIHVFKNQGPTTTAEAEAEITLDSPAVSVKGSMINSSTFSVSLDWKSENFGTGKIKIQSILLKLTFDKKSGGKEYALTGMEATKVVIDNKNVIDGQIKVESSEGYRVSAPIGTAFTCDVAGIFAPKAGGENDKSNPYRIGIAFPEMQLQVFDISNTKFGPSWYCAELFSIGLWVGIIMTLIFAFVCWWGFAMLANINTNDRFDDPKGKPLQVPQNE